MRKIAAKMQEKVGLLRSAHERLKQQTAGDPSPYASLVHDCIAASIDISEETIQYAQTLEDELNELDALVEQMSEEEIVQ